MGSSSLLGSESSTHFIRNVFSLEHLPTILFTRQCSHIVMHKSCDKTIPTHKSNSYFMELISISKWQVANVSLTNIDMGGGNCLKLRRGGGLN